MQRLAAENLGADTGAKPLRRCTLLIDESPPALCTHCDLERIKAEALVTSAANISNLLCLRLPRVVLRFDEPELCSTLRKRAPKAACQTPIYSNLEHSVAIRLVIESPQCRTDVGGDGHGHVARPECTWMQVDGHQLAQRFPNPVPRNAQHCLAIALIQNGGAVVERCCQVGRESVPADFTGRKP